MCKIFGEPPIRSVHDNEISHECFICFYVVKSKDQTANEAVFKAFSVVYYHKFITFLRGFFLSLVAYLVKNRKLGKLWFMAFAVFACGMA